MFWKDDFSRYDELLAAAPQPNLVVMPTPIDTRDRQFWMSQDRKAAKLIQKIQARQLAFYGPGRTIA